MKYEYLTHTTNSETPSDENGNYLATITINIKCTDEIGPVFSKNINVVNNNSQTGFQVDEERQQAVNDYLTLINQE